MAETSVLIEAESFESYGGWVLDQQFMDQMGSPFLLAHGMGKPVADAVTRLTFSQIGEYRVWVRTRDWVGPWKKPEIPAAMRASGDPGKFLLLIDGKPLPVTFGTEGADWRWQNGGTIKVDHSLTLSLHDLTGFEGRCDAILFSTDRALLPPNRDPEMAQFRRKLFGFPEVPPDAGSYDMVVVGGGIAGICAAISATRNGLKVALIHDRPVLGGNNSSEVRVHLGGGINCPPYPVVGTVVKEVGSSRSGNAGSAAIYEDEKKLDVVQAETNISLFLNLHANNVEINKNRIVAVIAQNTRTGERLRFPATLFVDCTGDAVIGALSGADYRMGREGQNETGEELAPANGDKMTMGSSVMWYSRERAELSTFPLIPWAVQFNDKACQKVTRGDWDWETGMNHDQIAEFEYIRDYELRAVYGNWSFLKNVCTNRQAYAKWELDWVAYVAGKRESRRLMGDVVLRQQDIVGQTAFPDACVVTTWSIDLHYPKKAKDFQAEPFLSSAVHKDINPYAIPYRCLYSRNVRNLFMAGRNISVTHVALGTVRVMRTTGMMGEVVGMAAWLCKKHGCEPCDVYADHLEEFKELLRQGVPRSVTAPNSHLR